MADNSLPLHVGLIMDGNGRWAKKRLLPRSMGHKAGMDRMITLAEHAKELGIKYLTVYALSTENLSRPKEEVDGLFELFRKYFEVNAEKLYKNNSAVKVIGDMTPLPKDIQGLVLKSEKNSPENPSFTLTFAINYGSRNEILNAVNSAIERGEKLDEEGFNKLLYTSSLPDVDLIIRTGGELRLSNFLLYQAAYAELYFSKVLFPDFSNRELDKALKDYASRDRRFGKIK